MILPVMLLLIFGTIQFALIYHAKITLNYAAFEAVRAGTLGHGKFDEVKEGFSRGLAPLYSYFVSEKDAAEENQKEYQKEGENKKIDVLKATDALGQIDAFQIARNRIYDEFDSENKLIRIERLNPTPASFLDFAPDEDIPNNNLMYRSSEVEAKSRTSIQDANLLHLRITYWYPLYVPLVNKLIFNVFICHRTGDDDRLFGKKIEDPGGAYGKWSNDPVCNDKDQAPVIPLTATAVMRMQTPLIESSGYFEKD